MKSIFTLVLIVLLQATAQAAYVEIRGHYAGYDVTLSGDMTELRSGQQESITFENPQISLGTDNKKYDLGMFHWNHESDMDELCQSISPRTPMAAAVTVDNGFLGLGRTLAILHVNLKNFSRSNMISIESGSKDAPYRVSKLTCDKNLPYSRWN